MRGEYSYRGGTFFLSLELPPRARRILRISGIREAYLGTTSACAENTCSIPRKLYRWWNYLRVRGEYANSRHSPDTTQELPPRARRIQYLDVLGEMPAGTTSACAENTVTFIDIYHEDRNYLRVRGEYRYFRRYHFWGAELPPRARRIP